MPDISPSPEENAVIEAAMQAAAEQDAAEAVIAEPEVAEEVAEEAPVAEEPTAEPEPAAVEEPAPVAEPVAEPELTDEEKAEAELKAQEQELGIRTQKASARFRELNEVAKQVEPLQARVAELERPAEFWNHTEQFLQANDLDLDTMGRALTMAAGIRSSDFSVLEKTAAGLEVELKAVYQKLGREGGGYDPLREPGNQDIALALEDGDISRARALELAAARTKVSHYEGSQQRAQEQAQQSQAFEQARGHAVEELNSLGDEYASIDPRFAEKAAILEPVMKTLFAKTPPNQWAGLYREAYKGVRLPDAPAVPRAAPALRNQPLRTATLPASAVGDPEPAGMEDVMNLALKAAAARDGVPFRG